jgi:hypothetical protein
LHFRIAEALISWVPFRLEQAHIQAVEMFACAAFDGIIWRKCMSALDLPVPVRALSVIVAIALVATMAAPLLFVAAQIVS